MMLKVIVYAYTQKIYSSRKIEKALRENIGFMRIGGRNKPDFHTIDHFRGETKVGANSNPHKVVWAKKTQKYKEKLQKQAEELLGEIERVNGCENEEYGEKNSKKSRFLRVKYLPMTDTWRLLNTHSAHGAWNMAVDQAILEHIGRGEAIPTLRLYAWDPPCLSLGQAQSFADVDVARLEERGWDVVRRPTGGRAILHTDEITYSIIAPADEPRVAGSILESYNRLSAALLQAVEALGLPARTRPLSVEIKEDTGPSHETPNPVCFEVPSAYEITVNRKKLIGSAQARRKEGVLQHGSLPLTGNLARITEALTFPDDSARLDAAARLLLRATTVQAVLGHEVLWNDAAQALVWGFEAKLGLSFEVGELSANEQSRADELVQEKYNHPDWTRRI